MKTTHETTSLAPKLLARRMSAAVILVDPTAFRQVAAVRQTSSYARAEAGVPCADLAIR